MEGAAAVLYRHLGLPGAGLIFMLEGLGAPIPVEIPLFIIGSTKQASFWSLVFLVWITTVTGNTAGYFLGYYGGRPMALKLIRWFRIRSEVWTKAETWFQRHGLRMLVATRWINWGFAQNMWLCGITRVSFRRFFVVMVINDLFWAAGWTWTARFAVSQFRRAGAHVLYHGKFRVAITALIVFAVVGLIWFAVRWWKRRRPPNPSAPSNPKNP